MASNKSTVLYNNHHHLQDFFFWDVICLMTVPHWKSMLCTNESMLHLVNTSLVSHDVKWKSTLPSVWDKFHFCAHQRRNSQWIEEGAYEHHCFPQRDQLAVIHTPRWSGFSFEGTETRGAVSETDISIQDIHEVIHLGSTHTKGREVKEARLGKGKSWAKIQP